MISPTIGRVVLIKGRIGNGGTQAEPALVTYVHGDRLINVGGFSSMGVPFALDSITLLQDDDAEPTGHYASWMPYQKGQAAKTEAAEAALKAVA